MASCLIYYYSHKSRKQIIHELGTVTYLPVLQEEFIYTLDYGERYFGIHLNETAAEKNEKIEPGDYRMLPYLIDIDAEDLEDEELAPLVEKILNYFWSHQEAAVAECSFENDLPFSGGHEKVNMNWPNYGNSPD